MDKGGTRISVCHIGRRDERIIKEDRVYLDMCWDNFAPVKRFGTQWDRVFDKVSQWIGIDTPVHTSYSQEDPHWTGMGWIEDPSKEMIFRISPFGGNSVREQPPVMSFGKRERMRMNWASLFTIIKSGMTGSMVSGSLLLI